MKKIKHRCVYCKKTDAEKFYRYLAGRDIWYHASCYTKKLMDEGRSNF